MHNWATIASLATAGGTLVLAVATFASIRSANRSARTAERAARTAERSLLASQRPLLVNSRPQDPEQKIEFYGGNWLHVAGGQASVEVSDDAVFMAVSMRNVGTGLAVMHGWHVFNSRDRPVERVHPPPEDFISQIRDIYVAPGDTGLWQGALRDPGADAFRNAVACVASGEPLVLSLLYGDFEGGQRVITQFVLRPANERWFATVARHFSIDEPDPRETDHSWVDAAVRRARQIRDGVQPTAAAEPEPTD